MLPTPRTQPYRAGTPRMPGMVLNAMLGGRAQGMLNPADFARQRMALGAGRPRATTDIRGQQPGLESLLQQRMRPRATTDIRNRHGFGDQQAALQQLILQSLLAPQRVV